MYNHLVVNNHTFQTTRYQGSKRKLLPWIYEILNEISFDSVLDGFGGTGSVSYLLKSMGKKVTYNDYLRFNSIIALSLIENSKTVLSDEDITVILKNQSDAGNFINLLFENIYYLNCENEWIEKVIININKFNLDDKTDIHFKKAIALNALFQSCIIKRPFNLFHRKNLYMRTNNVERSFGNKTTWDRDFEHYFRKFVKEVNNSVFETEKNCKVQNADIFAVDGDNFDLVYLDPPYVLENSKNESSNYLNCYHFLEGLADYEHWFENIDFESQTLRLKTSYLPNYFKASNVNETFENLIYKFRKNKIVISYKHGGKPTIDFILTLLKKNGKTVRTYSRPYKYALNRQNGSAMQNREYLIIGI
jgi:adenine-specific DNA methylase